MFPAVPSTTVPPGLRLTLGVSSVEHDGRARYSQALFLRIANDTKCCPILHTTSWVLKLSLPDNVAAGSLRQLREANLWSQMLERVQCKQEAYIYAYQRCVPDSTDKAVDCTRSETSSKGTCAQCGRHGQSRTLSDHCRTQGSDLLYRPRLAYVVSSCKHLIMSTVPHLVKPVPNSEFA